MYANAAQPRDQDAAAVASWYQSPVNQGAVFAALAQGSDVQPGYLYAAIQAERALPGTYGPDMDILERWLERAPRHETMTPASRPRPAASPKRGKGRS